MQVDDRGSEAEGQQDEVIIGDLVARREGLQIVINELQVSEPSTVLSLVALQLSLILLIVSVALVLAPSFQQPIPNLVSTIAAFMVVIFGFATYVAVRRFTVEHERRRTYRALVRRAEFLVHKADDFLNTVPQEIVASK